MVLMIVFMCLAVLITILMYPLFRSASIIDEKNEMYFKNVHIPKEYSYMYKECILTVRYK